LEADPAYCGLVVKNPLHVMGRTNWRRTKPYSLGDLNDFLFERDKKFWDREATQDVLGRNCTIFNNLRKLAWTKFRKVGDCPEFYDYVVNAALQLNLQFLTPLGTKEVMNIVKSVSRWVAQNYDPEVFSRIQSGRAKRRWAKHHLKRAMSDMVESATLKKALIKDTRPWEHLGISRRTWYRKKKAGTLPTNERPATS
jgi:hypothetical protein